MAELTEVMWQKGDENFVYVLNNIRIEDNANQIQMRKMLIKNLHPDDTLSFAEKSPKDDHNASKIDHLNHLEIKIESIDVFTDSTPMHLQTSLSSRSSSTTVGLSSLLKLKKGVCIMITSNIDLADRLLNGQFGLMFDFAYINSSITKVYVKLDDQKGSKNAMSKTCMLQSIKLCQFRQLKQILSSVKIIQKHLKEISLH